MAITSARRALPLASPRAIPLSEFLNESVESPRSPTANKATRTIKLIVITKAKPGGFPFFLEAVTMPIHIRD